MALLLCAILVGAVVPVQTGINTRLRQAVGSPLITAMYTFVIAVALVFALLVVAHGHPLPGWRELSGQPWWLWLGGFMGVAFIVGNILIFPRIGAVQTVILPILGQTVMGLLIDALALFRSPLIPLTLPRVCGALIALVGVLVVIELPRAVRESRQAAGESSAGSGVGAWGWRVFAVAIGMGSATQTAVNGQLGRVLGSPVQAGGLSLVVGLVVLILLSTMSAARGNATWRPSTGPWWMWLGGVLGAVFVIGGATLAPIIGTGTMVIASISGAIITGQLLELRGSFGVQRTRLTASRVAGLVAIIAGVALVRFF